MKKRRKHFGDKNFMRDDMWLMFIDGHRLNEGPYAFDKENEFSQAQPEPGYVEGMINAYDFTQQFRDRKITVDYIQHLHDTCVDPLGEKGKEIKGYRSQGTGFGLILKLLNQKAGSENISPEGIQELSVELAKNIQKRVNSKNYAMHQIVYLDHNTGLEQTYLVYPSEDALAKGQEYCKNNNIKPKDLKHVTAESFELLLEKNDYDSGHFRLIAAGSNSKKTREYANEDLQEFNRALKNAKKSKDPDAVLKTIVKYVRTSIQAHDFKDGNSRTFAIHMLNELLERNGYSRAIIMNPLHFDGFSVNELVKEVKEGMQIYQDFRTTRLKAVIKRVSPRSIGKSSDDVRQQIEDALSKHPIAQLAQLNDIFKKLDSGELKPRGISLLSKGVSVQLKKIIKDIYSEKVENIKNDLDEGNPNAAVRSEKILDDIVSRHDIAKAMQKTADKKSDMSSSVSEKASSEEVQKLSL